MNLTASRRDVLGARLATLLGTASLFTISQAMTAQAQQVAQGQVAQAQMAQTEEVPENVLITGSLIRGAAAVGVPVTNLGPQDFSMTGALNTAELFRTVPAANVAPGPVATMSGANIERATRVNIRSLDTGDATRSLLMVDGLRVPAQGNGVCEIDPSIIPALSLDRIDVLVDGASATYGSDAVAGVINLILKRNFDGATTQVRYTTAPGGKNRYLASQLWGRTWDGGDITLSYEWYDDSPIKAKTISKMTVNYSPWGLDNRIPLNSSMPGTISAGLPFQTLPTQLNGAPNKLGTTATTGTNCLNCWAIPHGTGGNFNPGTTGVGPTAPFSASTLNWASFNSVANGGTNGVRNAFNPYDISWYDAAQQRNGGAITVDQRLTKDISFYGEAFYSNRRAEFLSSSFVSPNSTNDLLIAVPTFNPYYPTGGAPTNLRVAYNMGVEHPSFTDAYELADRYMGGLHIALPYNWNADVYYSHTYDSSFNHVTNAVNKNAVSAALGWTIPTSPATGTSPAIATWTKPANVPYLNLFCDATEFSCNSSATLAYITGLRQFDERYGINEKGAKFDGPLFDLPAGTVKGAIGGTYTSSTFTFARFDSTSAPTLIAPLLTDTQHRQVWAGFAQLNVPIFGENFSFPLLRKVELEASWRHDQYSDVGGTSNPKIALNWTLSEDAGLTFRGAWGTNFRAPSFGEISPLANNASQLFGLPAIIQNNSTVSVNCNADPGSGGYRLLHPSVGPAWNGAPAGDPSACGSGAQAPGYSFLGSATIPAGAGLRDFVNTTGKVLQPEQATNWAAGLEIAPTAFFKGLDIQATYYIIKITGVLQSFGNPTSNAFNNSSRGFSYIVPTDLYPFDSACNNNSTPTTCPEFEQMVANMLSDPSTSVPPSAKTLIQWINDGGTFNKGWRKMQGIDFTASYDFDLGDFGAWNTGIVGTYYLHDETQTFPGEPINDAFHTTVSAVGNVQQIGVVSGNGPLAGPRMHYRARLGWSNGSWSVTGFMNYDSHFYHTQSAPPNVNGQCLTTGGSIGGGTFPCAIEGYSNIVPSQAIFDLSVGYDTGDTPANEYLRNVSVQLVVQNILGKEAAFEYRSSSTAGNPAAYDVLKSIQGRTISFIVTKTW